MTSSSPVIDLLAAASATAKQAQAKAQDAADATAQRAAAVEIEEAAIDIVSVFEARMQHHFKRGPFFKELQKRMNAEGQDALGTQVMQYAHAVNVLKHGHGKSHRALLDVTGLPFKVRKHDRDDTDIGLVDVLSDGFFDGLVDALTQAHSFLES